MNWTVLIDVIIVIGLPFIAGFATGMAYNQRQWRSAMTLKKEETPQ